MINWKDEFKKYLAKKINENLKDTEFNEYYVDFDDIELIPFENNDVDLISLDITDLVRMYAFAITREDFEFAEKINNEIKSRNCKIEIDADENSNTAVLNLYIKPDLEISHININMKIYPDGMMIDFDKYDL